MTVVRPARATVEFVDGYCAAYRNLFEDVRSFEHSGTTGRRENQQIGVLLVYTSAAGCAFIDLALYLPEE